MSYLRIRNWEKFQHYKHRNPPWIRLYTEILDKYEMAAMPDATKWHLVGIWLLASRCDNRLPDDAAWIAQRIAARSTVDLDTLIAGGFLERCEDSQPGVVPLRATR